MSKQKIYAIINIAVWLIVLTVFIIVFATGDSYKELHNQTEDKLIVAVFYLFGFAWQLAYGFFVKYRKEKIQDERTQLFQYKSMGFGFILTLCYVFLYTMAIYTAYETSGLVPVPWLFFLAYSIIPVANISSSTFILIEHIRGEL